MSKYHINTKGEAGLCRAKNTCPFGDFQADHFATLELAREEFEHRAASALDGLEYNAQLLVEREGYYEQLEEQLKKATEQLKKGELSKEKVKAIRDELKVATDQIREAVYQWQISEKEAQRYGLVEIDPDAKPFLTEAAKRSNKLYLRTLKKKRSFERPMSAETYRVMVDEFAGWSGLPREEAKKLLRSYDKNSGMSRDEYVVSLFQEKGNENKKSISFVDLETTAFHPTMGEIIEIGIVKVDSEGNVLDTLDMRFDIDETAREKLGTGPVEVHKIKPEDIKGKEKFSSPAVQARVAEFLNDPETIVSAHNFNFEKQWLDHNLEGFYEVRDNNSYENIANKTSSAGVIDTRNVAMFLGHSLPNTRLESFAEANGIKYRDAHSAFPDAEMSMKAFMNFRKSLMESPKGERPQLTIAK